MIKDREQSSVASPGTVDDTSLASPEERTERHHSGPRAAEIENVYHRAVNYLEKNEFDRAARAFRSVLLLDPAHYKALTGLGRCLAEIGMYEEARKCFKKALEIKPDYAQARINLELWG